MVGFPHLCQNLQQDVFLDNCRSINCSSKRGWHQFFIEGSAESPCQLIHLVTRVKSRKKKKKNRCFRGNMPDMNFGNFGCEVVWLWLRINKHWSYHWRSKIAQHTCHNLQLEQSNESNSEWIPSPKMSLLKQQMEFGRASFFPASKRAMDICKSSSKAVLIGWSATVEEVGCGHKMDAYKMEKENRKPKIMKRMSKSEPSTEFRIQWW